MSSAAARRLTVEWLDEPADYRRRAAEAGTNTLLVLRPVSAERAAFWDKVLSTRFAPRPATLAGGARLVVAWGTMSAAAGSLYARHTGAESVTSADLDGVLHAVESSSADQVVVLAAAKRLTVAAIGQLSAVCRRAHATLGILCGRDEAALSFAAAKALLRPNPGLSGVDVVDAPAHRSEENLRLLPAGYQESLRRPTLAKLLRTHGEGGHAKLPDVVICGLLDAVEFPGAPDAGCSRVSRRCKRAEPRGASVLFADELAAPVVAFLCCNGFNVAGELYPSPVSMALGMAEGEASAVLAPVRPLVATDAMVALIHTGLTTGQPLGELVAELNMLAARIGQRDAFALHGDPGAVLPGDEPLPGQRVPLRHDYDHDGVPLIDLQEHLVLTRSRAERGRRLLRSARAWWGDRGADALRPLATRLDRLEDLVINALKWAEIDPTGESFDRLERTGTLVRLGVAGWDRAMAELLSARDTVDAFDIGHYDQVLAEVVDGPPCARCGTPTEIHVYGRAEPVEERREARLCGVCGPVSEGRVAGLRLALPTALSSEPGASELVLTAELVPPAGPLPVDSVALQLRFFDKANDVCVHDEARPVPAEAGTVVFRIGLPAELGIDLHSIRLVGVCGFDLAYARARFAGLPRAASG